MKKLLLFCCALLLGLPCAAGAGDAPPAYAPPEELGDALSAEWVYQLAGDLYSLPTPVSAFLDNGWTVAEEADEPVPAGKKLRRPLTLAREGLELEVAEVMNFGSEPAAPSDCTILSPAFSFNMYQGNSGEMAFTLPGGIGPGSTTEELLAAYGEALLENDGGGYKYYAENRDYTDRTLFLILIFDLDDTGELVKEIRLSLT